MDEKNIAPFEKWETEVLAKITKQIEVASEELRGKTIDEFNALMPIFANKCIEGFLEIFGLASVDEIDTLDVDTQNAYIVSCISALNAGLPIDFPYIITLIFSDLSPNLRTSVMQRRILPGYRELIDPKLVPFVHVKDTVLDGKKGINLQIIDVTYGNS